MSDTLLRLTSSSCLDYARRMSVVREPLKEIERAAGVENTNLIVRSEFAIAEVRGPLAYHCTGRWLRLGVEGQSHLHLKVEAVVAVEFTASDEANAALKVLGQQGSLLCRIVFRHTNPKANLFDAARRLNMIQMFSEPAAQQ